MTDFRAAPNLAFECVANFRDMGGHTTHDGRRLAPGRLLRAGHLGHATDKDLALLEPYGLQRVFDFRTAADIKLEGEDRLTSQAQCVRLPMPDPAKGTDIRALMENSTPADLDGLLGLGSALRAARGAGGHYR